MTNNLPVIKAPFEPIRTTSYFTNTKFYMIEMFKSEKFSKVELTDPLPYISI